MASNFEENSNEVLLNLMVIYDKKFGISKDDKFPFPRFKVDFQFMCDKTRAVTNPTKRNVLVFGRKSWFADIEINRAVWSSEYIIVLSREIKSIDGVNFVANSFENVIAHLQQPSLSSEIENIWLMGGSFLYKLAMESDLKLRLYATEILFDFGCDIFFPFKELSGLKEISDNDIPTTDVVTEDGYDLKFHVYERN